MKFDKLDRFKNGWLVGNFNPALYCSEENDIGILFINKGVVGDGHYHKLHTEYNIIVRGSALVNGIILNVGDIFVYEPEDRSYVTYLEDTILIVLKNPATKEDKYY